MKLSRKQSHLLIVDVQDRLTPAVVGVDALLGRLEFLTKVARRLDVPITISEQYPKGLGRTSEVIRNAAGNAAVTLDKVHFSCLEADNLKNRFHELREQGRDQMIVAGMEAHVCVLQTALDLNEAGYCVAVVADAVSSRSEASKRLAIDRLRQAGCSIVDAEMVMFEWLGEAATPEFKELQQLIK